MRSFPIHITWVLLLGACGSNPTGTKRDNIADPYGRVGSGIDISARIHHETPERSTVYYKVPTRDLLYKSDGAGSPFRAVFRVSYETYADWSTKTLLDSASTLLQDRTQDPTEDKELIGSIDLPVNGRPHHLLRITVHDLNRDVQSFTILRMGRNAVGARQSFMPITEDGVPLFTDHFTTSSGPVRIRCRGCGGNLVHGTYRRSTPELPSPVFTSAPARTTSSNPDSSFTIQVDGDGDLILHPKAPGAYHLRTDTTATEGYVLFVLDESYPYVGTGPDMLRPLRYITSMQEYERISRSANVRQAIERFWLDAAGDRERARDAIRIYYGRVENANRYFTAHVEGWRTDRGLVHIIFGMPNSIHRNDARETWVFGEENNLLSLTFTFVKRDNPLTENDMTLDRDPSFKGAWYRNVESWRNGRVYQN